MINNILQTWAVFLQICRKVQMQQQGKSTFLKTCAKNAILAHVFKKVDLFCSSAR